MNHSGKIMSFLAFLFSVTSFFGCSKTVSEINVKDFGAIPNDGKDDTPAIIKALEECKGKTSSKLIFDFGTYDIYGSQKDERGNFLPSVDIKNPDNLTIEGNGSEFVGHDYASMFHFSNCSNLSISNLTIDWDPLPYTQGKVTAS